MEEDGTMKQRDEKVPAMYRLAPPQTGSIPHELIPLLPANWPTEIPLARVTTCGSRVSLEVLYEIQSASDGPPTLVYGSPDAALLAEKSASTALILLSILASQPGCAASIDWLSETLRHPHQREEDDDDDREDRPGLKRVDNVVTLLRHLLFPPILRDLPTARQLRRRLVASYRASGESGSGYRLAGMPLVWIDVEAIKEQIKQARSLDQFGHDGLPAWQAAYALAERGVFLEREPYSDWASWRRQQVETQKWECVQALWQRLVDQGDAGETEAIRILQSYWQSHMATEDSFRPLIELLGKRECFGQAEEYYAHLCLALEQEGRQPDHRTEEVMTFVRALRIQRKPRPYQAISSVVETEQAASAQSLSPDERQQAVSLSTGQSESLLDILPGSFQESIESELTPSGQATLLPDNEANASSLVSTTYQLPVFNDQRTLLLPSSSPHVKSGLFLPGSLPVDLVPTANSLKDCAVWFGMRQAHIITYIVQWRKHALFCGELQEQLDQEIKMFDQVRYLFDDSEKYSISRRQVLISIAMLPVALLKVQQGYSSGIDIEEFLPRCMASITAVWHLLKGREFITAEEVLLECLPTLLAFARKASPYQEMAAQLASQNCLLMSLMARHRGNNLILDEWYSRKAVFYSESTENLLLKIGALKQLADTCYYRGSYDNMLTAYEKAWQYISMATTMDEIPVLIRARIYTGLAYACAKNNDTERAKNLLSEAHEFFPHVGPEADDHIPLYADCGIHSLYLWEGLTRHLLDQTEDAAKTYAQVEHLPSLNILIPERTRVEIITHQAANALAQGKMEAFCSYLTTTMNGIKSIQSEQRRQEAVTVYQQARQKWPNESHILELADLFVPLR